MNKPINYDITIIGGSFTGLSAALSLSTSNLNLKIAIIEKSNIINEDRKRDGRAFAISKNSLDVFDKIKITDSIKPLAGKIEEIKIIDGNAPFYLDFCANEGSKLNNSKKHFGLVIENFHIHNALKNKALEQNNITIYSPNYYKKIDFEENQASITLDNNQIISTKLLLACDGRYSPLREKFNIKTFNKSYKQTALVFNISHSKSHQNVALEKFLPDGPFAVLPMNDNFESSIVWTLESQKADTMLEIDQENFLAQLKKRIGNYLGDIKITNKAIKYDLNLIVADKFYHKRMAFVGDSAHGIHPIAGQGFNLGIDDIKILTDLIKENYECGLDIGSKTLLTKYNKIRKFGAYKMVLATDGLNGLFSNKSKTLKALRNSGLAIVEQIPSLKRFFIRSAGGK